MKLLFFGSDYYSTIPLQILLENQDVEVAGIVTSFNKPSMPFEFETVAEIAEKHTIPTFKVKNKRDIIDQKSQITNLEPDIGLVASFGIIIPKEVYTIPKYGTLNIHPSLLPKYRGPAPVESAILNGESETGVTIMEIAEGVDTGDVLAQKQQAIKPTHTSLTLYRELFEEGTQLFLELLVAYPDGNTPRYPQDNRAATHSQQYSNDDAKIDWEEPAEKISQHIRAYYPKPIAWTTLSELVAQFSNKNPSPKWDAKRVKIHSLQENEAILRPKVVQVEGKGEIDWESFSKGYLT